MVGIIGAMDMEVANFIEKLSDATTEKFSGIAYVKGKFAGTDVVAAKCGMGKVNAAICTQTMILEYSPDLIINTGVGGSVSPSVNVGDVVIGKNAVQHDMDLSPIGLKKGFIQELNAVYLPCAPAIVKRMEAAAQKLDITYFIGPIATGDQFINCREKKTEILNRFQALACEMEGASIAHVCKLNGIDFGIVRTISDNADGDSPEDFNAFLHDAAHKSIAIICGFLESYSESK